MLQKIRILEQNRISEEIYPGKYLLPDTPHYIWNPNMNFLKNRIFIRKSGFRRSGKSQRHENLIF